MKNKINLNYNMNSAIKLKANKKIVSLIFCVVLMIGVVCFVFLNQAKASTIIYRDDGYIEVYVDDLSNLSVEDLEKVVQISVKNNLPSEEDLLLFKKCVNLESIYFTYVDVPSLTFLNNVNSNRDINLYFLTSNVNFDGLENDKIVLLSIANSKIQNFKQIENLTSLKSIGLSETSGYEQIDYSKFSNLTSLALATYIENFESLINSISNVTDLSLASSNIQNKDTIYLEKLTNLRSLNLNQTYLTDIDFVKKLENLESLVLPWAVVDLSPIYELEKLTSLQWEAYTELNVSQELVDYLDSKNIWHYDYNSNIKEKIDSILDSLNLNSETDSKEALEKIVRYIVENTQPNTNEINGNPSNLDTLLYQNKGVCYHHSIAVYTLAKMLGIDDVYAVNGILMQFTHPEIGEDDSSVWSYMAHEWNLINYNGIWYGIDAAQMNDGSGFVSNNLFNYNFWKNPSKDDDYDLNYAYQEYLDFNYYFAKRHVETDGILAATWTYQFKDISGLDIRNHVIYNYDINDVGAVSLCDRVLDNYTCQYVDKDNNGEISSGDRINISKNNLIIETFTLSTQPWVEPPQEPHLGKITLEYVNYSFVDINGGISDLYYNKDNPLRIKIKGDNYIVDNEYDASIKIIDIEANEEIYDEQFKILGSELNFGKSLIINGDLLISKVNDNDMNFGSGMHYLIVVNVNDIERSYGLSFFSSKNDSTNYEGYYDGLEHTIKVPEWALSCDIKYSVNNNNYDLDILPKFKVPGEYVVTYLVDCGGNKITNSGNVKIYGIKEFDKSIIIKNNILMLNNNDFNNLKNNINVYSLSSEFNHLDEKKNTISSNTIKTGDYLNIKINNFKTFEYELAYIGDVNGNGEIDIYDYIRIMKDIMDITKLSGVYKEAADVTQNGEVDIYDYIRIMKKIMEEK